MSSKRRSDLTDLIATTVMRWQDATQAYDEAVGDVLGLNAAERRCIAFLHDGAKPAGGIATAVKLTPAAVTSLIDRLEKRGLLTRNRRADDRRMVMVELTETARAAIGQYYGSLAARGERMFDDYSKDDMKVIGRFLADALQLQESQHEMLFPVHKVKK